MSTTVYTDGACKNNPGPGAWAGLVIKGESETMITGTARKTTSNRMELMAVIASLTRVNAGTSVHVHTDSQYVQKGITQWIQKWVENGWKTSKGKPVKNEDLWKRLLALDKSHDVRYTWVKAHNGNELNERVNAKAQELAQKIARLRKKES